MAKQTIGIGTVADDGTGDPLRTAFDKANDNFDELYIKVPGAGVVSVAAAKTLTVSNTLTLTGTDASSVAFGAGGTVLYSGGALGTPASGTLTNATGLPAAGVVGTAAILGENTFSGHQFYSPDNTYDLGASGVTRPRNIYVAGIVNAGSSVYAGGNFRVGGGGYFYWDGRSGLTSPSDGVVRITNGADSGFTGLLLGPSGPTYNRLKHGGAGILQVRLADDSAFSFIQGKHRTEANAVSEAITPTHSLTVWDAAGTAYKFAVQAV